MKKLIALVLTLMFTLTAVAALAEAPATTDTPSKTLVVYYSATGSTERGFHDQHSGGQAFAHEESVMGWLFGDHSL